MSQNRAPSAVGGHLQPLRALAEYSDNGVLTPLLSLVFGMQPLSVCWKLSFTSSRALGASRPRAGEAPAHDLPVVVDIDDTEVTDEATTPA